MKDRELVIVGDEAWTREEWEVEQARLERRRALGRASYQRNRDHRLAYAAAWREQHRDERRAYNIEWMRRYREVNAPDGFLHDLGCDGSHRRKRRGCQPIAVYRKADAA